jgi:hypothetical protein
MWMHENRPKYNRDHLSSRATCAKAGASYHIDGRFVSLASPIKREWSDSIGCGRPAVLTSNPPTGS